MTCSKQSGSDSKPGRGVFSSQSKIALGLFPATGFLLILTHLGGTLRYISPGGLLHLSIYLTDHLIGHLPSELLNFGTTCLRRADLLILYHRRNHLLKLNFIDLPLCNNLLVIVLDLCFWAAFNVSRFTFTLLLFAFCLRL